MRVKNKHKNEYILSSCDNTTTWVRNFTRKSSFPVDINHLLTPADRVVVLKNELENSGSQIQNVDNLNLLHQKCVVVSDGYNFDKKQELLAKLPSDVTILAVNGVLKKWNLKHKRAINYFVVNNPYPDALLQIPTRHAYFPMCIMSSRVYHDFPKKYRGYKLKYVPVPQEDYQTKFHPATSYRIDDYRNPICAAIGLTFHFGVRKLLLFCCDDSFSDERPGAVKLDNNLWLYPPQKIAHSIIDHNLYWLANHENPISIKDHSSGPKYNYAEYIPEERILEYFETE